MNGSQKLLRLFSFCVNALAFLIPACSLATSWTTFRLTLLLSLLGLTAKLLRLTDNGKTPRLLYALATLAIVVSALSAYHSDRWGVVHLPIAIIVLMPTYWAFRVNGVKFGWAYAGAIVGAGIGAYLAIRTGGLEGNRDAGVFNPIPNGGMAIALALASACAIRHKPKHIKKQVWIAFCLTGVTCGIATSLLSGSKSGWISFALLPIGFAFYFPSVRAWMVTKAGVASTLSAMALCIAALMLSPGGQRINHGYDGIQRYIATGEVTEGSIGPRLEMWAYGLDMAPKAPILGIGKRAMEQDMQRRAREGEYAAMLAGLYTLHNEFLHVLVTNGIIGLLALLWVYAEVFLLFRPLEGRLISSGAFMAAGLGLIYLSLGVGEVAIQLKDLRNFFLFWAYILAAQSSIVTQGMNRTINADVSERS
jgi:O-antigen ligase